MIRITSFLGIFLTVIILITVSCVHKMKKDSASNLRGVASDIDTKKRHIILAIGGVRSTKDSFGKFPEIIGSHLEQIDSNYKVTSDIFTFDIHDFEFNSAKKVIPNINSKLDELFKKSGDPNPQQGDRLSIVMYSMGGNIGVRWLNESIEADSKYLEYLDNFILLGAPVWGAKEAGAVLTLTKSLGFNLDDFLKIEWVQALANTTGEQVEFISPLRHGTHLARQSMINWTKNPKIIENFKNKYHFRVLSAIGLFPCAQGALKKDWFKIATSNFNRIFNEAYNDPPSLLTTFGDNVKFSSDCKEFVGGLDASLNYLLTTTSLGGIRRESDGAVIAPSANLNFIYASDLNVNYNASQLISSKDFHEIDEQIKANSKSSTEFQSFYSQITHATLTPNTIDDFVVITEDCADFEKPKKNCSHSYKYLVRDLARCDRKDSTCNLEKAKKFHDSAFYEIQPNLFPDKNISDENKDTKEIQPLWKDDIERAKQIRSFVLELNLRVPKSYDIPEDFKDLLKRTRNILNYSKFNFKNKNFHNQFVNTVEKNTLEFTSNLFSLGWNNLNTQSSNFFKFISDGLIESPSETKYTIQIARSLELFSRLVEIVDIKDEKGIVTEKHIRVFLTGRIMPKNEDVTTEEFWESLKDGAVIPFTIELDNLKPRNVEAVVKPGLTTYVDLAMAPSK